MPATMRDLPAGRQPLGCSTGPGGEYARHLAYWYTRYRDQAFHRAERAARAAPPLDDDVGSGGRGDPLGDPLRGCQARRDPGRATARRAARRVEEAGTRGA